ncbi:MAG: hypothetical protein WCJ87_13745 [Burkholderiales bacterium]
MRPDTDSGTGCLAVFLSSSRQGQSEALHGACEGMHRWRCVRSEFVTRGEAAVERWKQDGGGHEVDEVMGDLQARLDDAKRRAAQRAGR